MTSNQNGDVTQPAQEHFWPLADAEVPGSMVKSVTERK